MTQAGGSAENYYGPVGMRVDTIVNMAGPRTEWEKQKEFERALGVECCKEARQWLEYLMEQRGFTCGELGRTWRYGALGWSREDAEPKFKTPLYEAVVWWGFVGFASLLFMSWGFFMALHEAPLSIEKTVWFYATGLTYLSSIYLACRFVLWPRKVASRARRIWILDNDCVINRESVS